MHSPFLFSDLDPGLPGRSTDTFGYVRSGEADRKDTGRCGPQIPRITGLGTVVQRTEAESRARFRCGSGDGRKYRLLPSEGDS